MLKTAALFAVITIISLLAGKPALAQGELGGLKGIGGMGGGFKGIGGMGGGFKGIGGMGGGCKGLGGMGGGFRGVGDAGGGFDSWRSNYDNRYQNNRYQNGRYGNSYSGRYGINNSNSNYGYRFNGERFENQYGRYQDMDGGRYGENESSYGTYQSPGAGSGWSDAAIAVATLGTLRRLREIRQNSTYCAPNHDATSFGTGTILETARRTEPPALQGEGTGLNPDSMGAFRMYSENP